MFLAQVIYCSETNNLNMQEIENILSIARKNNSSLGISGLLLFNSKFFLQCLEGSRKSINEVYQKILNDERHSNPVILKYSEISQRDFAEWDMGYVSELKNFQDILWKYSKEKIFNPYLMSGESAFRLLRELKQLGAGLN